MSREVPPRLAVITTHPVQYYAPVFRHLAANGAVTPRVFYGWSGAASGEALDRGFGTSFQWDVPLLEGYEHTFVENVSRDPNAHHFRGIDGPTLISEVEAWGPDAVLVYGWSYRSHLRALRAFHRRVPVLFRGDSTLLDEDTGPLASARTLIRRGLLRWVYRHVDLALYVGQRNREYFEAHGLGDNQLVWAPHSVENARFQSAPGRDYNAEAARWRSELKIGPNDRTILFAGKLEPKKAPDVLLEAFLQGFSPDRPGPAVHLLFAGTGPLEVALRARTGGDPRVHFLGFQNQSQMPVVYRLGDVFALPSRGPGETWGLAVNEAMACSRPIVVTDRVGCAPDLVSQLNGAVVPSEDAPALAKALSRVVGGDLAAMGSASARRIEAWSIPEQVRRIEGAVEYAVNGSGMRTIGPDTRAR